MRSTHSTINNQKGFTLIEIIAVLVLLGILAAVAVPKYMDLTDNAKQKAVDAGIAEMNSRESLIWGKVKLQATVPTTDILMDAAVLAHADYNTVLGPVTDYNWTVGPTAAGGSLQFQSGTTVPLTRTAATVNSPATWKRT
jgi:prepilin-type N-terminal cleavage/methylation domain-containing protein